MQHQLSVLFLCLAVVLLSTVAMAPPLPPLPVMLVAPSGTTLHVEVPNIKVFRAVRIIKVVLDRPRCTAFFYGNFGVDAAVLGSDSSIRVLYSIAADGFVEPEEINPRWIAYVASQDCNRINVSREWIANERVTAEVVAFTLVHELAHVAECRLNGGQFIRVWEEGYHAEQACFGAPYRGPTFKKKED